MKASELMIGDLVKTNKGDLINVESISTKRQHRKVGYHTEEDCAHIKYVRQGRIEPIPLTEDILKANGIRYQFGYPWWQKADPFGSPNQYEIHINVVTTVIVTYVHELQQALRLCKLNDLVDNFKVE